MAPGRGRSHLCSGPLIFTWSSDILTAERLKDIKDNSHHPRLEPRQKIIYMGHDIMVGILLFDDAEDFFGLFGTH